MEDDYVESTQEDADLVNMACMIGILQGRYPGHRLGANSIDDMHMMGLLTPDKKHNLSQFMAHCMEMLGPEVTVATLADLILNDILVFDQKKFEQHVQVDWYDDERLQ